MSLPPATTGQGKWYAGFVAAFAATWVVDTMDKVYMIDFTQYGMSDAVFKGFLEGTFVSFIVWLTPNHIVQTITCAIIFVRDALKQWRDALTNKED